MDRVGRWKKTRHMLSGTRDLRQDGSHLPQLCSDDSIPIIKSALRLLERVLQAYARAFQFLLGDAIYAQAPFLNFLVRHGKQALWFSNKSIATCIKMCWESCLWWHPRRGSIDRALPGLQPVPRFLGMQYQTRSASQRPDGVLLGEAHCRTNL
jgi:hypothetical protein